jgi:NitT/TauT family transport system substrate-binding protein
MDRWLTLPLVALLLAACQAAPAPPTRSGAATPVGVAAPAQPAAAAPQAAPSAAPAAGAPLETVRVGSVGSATDATFVWAQQRGYLQEVGLDVDVTVFNGAQLMIPPLGTDQLDVGGGAPGPGLFNAILRGVSVRIVGDRSRAAPGARHNCLAVRKSLLESGAIRSFADWRGRVFAENVPGVVTTLVVERELQQVGLGLQDLTLTTLSFADILTGFANEAVDAGVLVEPFLTVGDQRGVGQCWKPTSEMWPNFQIAVMLYGPAFAEQRAESARRFMVAHLRAMRDYYRAFYGDGQHRAELLQLMGSVSGVSDLGLLDRLAPTWVDPNGTVNVDSLRDAQQWYLKRGELTGEVDFDRIVDMSFVDHALGQLGRYAVP